MKVAINGFGRIGRLVFRIIDNDSDFEVVAINDVSDAKELAHLLKYDSNHGNYRIDDITYSDDYLLVGDKKIRVFSELNPELLPWDDMEVDLVFECSGKFTKLEDANKHILAGASKVIISAPGKGDMKTVVYGVNQDILDGSEEIISAASCTTNCLAPVLKVINDNFGIERGFMTTVHAYTNDQVVLDVSHKKGIESRRGRAAFSNIVPTSTGAASAIGKVIPALDGKLEGSALRVPVATGSVVDLVLELASEVDEDLINKTFSDCSNEVLKFTMDPIVSSDVIGTSYGAIVDGMLTKVQTVNGRQLVKIVAWYDNEMGYSNQMVRLAKCLIK